MLGDVVRLEERVRLTEARHEEVVAQRGPYDEVDERDPGLDAWEAKVQILFAEQKQRNRWQDYDDAEQKGRARRDVDEREKLADDRDDREADNRRKEHGPDAARPERAHHEVSGNQENGRHN